METSELTKKIQTAKSEIISYQTLPPQIDYRVPWKVKADKALLFINSLPERLSTQILAEIESVVDEYYGENGAAQYDCLL